MPNDNILNNNVIPVVAVEFSRPVDVTLLGRKGRSFEFQVGAAERAALARRYSVVSIDRLEAQCDIIPERKGCFRLNGGFTAAVVQLCVISLETVAERVTGKFSLLLQQQQPSPEMMTDIDFMVDDVDVEFLSSDVIDIGEIISQYLSLEITAFPRKPGATGSELGTQILKEENSPIAAEIKNPFELLKSLKHKT